MGNAASLAELMNNKLFFDKCLHLEEDDANDLTRGVAVLATGVVNDSTLHDNNIKADENTSESS